MARKDKKNSKKQATPQASQAESTEVVQDTPELDVTVEEPVEDSPSVDVPENEESDKVDDIKPQFDLSSPPSAGTPRNATIEVPDTKPASSVAFFFDHQKPKDEFMKINDDDSEEVRQLKTNYNLMVSETTTLRTQLKEQQSKVSGRPDYGKMRSTAYSASKPNANAPLSRANQRIMGATTLRRRQMLQEKLSTVKNQLAQWINGLLSYNNDEDEDENRRPLTADTILDRLSTGVVLCELAIRISPIASMAIPRIHTKAKAYSILAHENVKYFINACISFGVLRHELFEPNSLLNTNPDNRNEREVVFSILSLSRVALQKYNIQPPSMVMAEELIDLLDKLGNDSKSDDSEGPDSTGLSRSDDDKIREALEAFCRTHDVDLASIPSATDRRGQFRFADGTNAHVRMFEAPNLDPEADGEGETISTLLVRYGNTWEDVLTFIAEHTEKNGSVGSVRTATTTSTGPLSVSQKLALAKKQRADEADAAVNEAVKKAIDHAVNELPALQLHIEVIAPPQVSDEEIAQLRAAAAEAIIVKQEVITVKQTVVEAEEKAKETEVHIQKVETTVTELQTELAESKKEIEAVKTEVTQTKQDLEQTKQDLEQTKQDLDQTKQDLEVSTKQHEEAKQEIAEITATAAAAATVAATEITSLNAEIEALKAKVLEFETKETQRLEQARVAEEERIAEEKEAAAAEAAELEQMDNKIEISINRTTVDQLDDFDKRTMASMNLKFDLDAMQKLDKRARAGETLTAEERRQLDKYSAKREFFYMTCLAVKMGHKLRDEAQVVAPTDELWIESCAAHVPFHKFVRWISQKITMRVLAADSAANSKPKAGVSLRSFRTGKANVMAQRKLTKHDNDDEFM